jgi:hypothetical protein
LAQVVQVVQVQALVLVVMLDQTGTIPFFQLLHQPQVVAVAHTITTIWAEPTTEEMADQAVVLVTTPLGLVRQARVYRAKVLQVVKLIHQTQQVVAAAHLKRETQTVRQQAAMEQHQASQVHQ